MADGCLAMRRTSSELSSSRDTGDGVRRAVGGGAGADRVGGAEF